MKTLEIFNDDPEDDEEDERPEHFESFDPDLLTALEMIVSKSGTGFQIQAVHDAIHEAAISLETLHAIKRLEIEHTVEIDRIMAGGEV